MNRRGEVSRRVDQPEPGFFRMRLVKGGPFVAARIVHVDGLWSAEIDGVACGEASADPALAEGVFRIWHWGERITEQQAATLLGTKTWALLHAPDHPATRPDEPINVNQLPPLF